MAIPAVNFYRYILASLRAKLWEWRRECVSVIASFSFIFGPESPKKNHGIKWLLNLLCALLWEIKYSEAPDQCAICENGGVAKTVELSGTGGSRSKKFRNQQRESRPRSSDIPIWGGCQRATVVGSAQERLKLPGQQLDGEDTRQNVRMEHADSDTVLETRQLQVFVDTPIGSTLNKRGIRELMVAKERAWFQFQGLKAQIGGWERLRILANRTWMGQHEG
ncbi:hypothetical protein B0H16DRAFT_1469438 [Mycena metata]|uniref:Uncharacterized protein n=1 Tax=Mycena metata TaxID=1033252 RepID=A0AAD7HXY3_9AGAR|nr:hypothetical protein B0H16DRAFT_1469438 [Mycena metata]